MLRQILERGVRRGELSESAEASLDLAVDFAFGVMWYRLLSRHAPVDDDLAADLAAALEKLLSGDGVGAGEAEVRGEPGARRRWWHGSFYRRVTSLLRLPVRNLASEQHLWSGSQGVCPRNSP
ncbi:TetR-like C-terminal domain-containing protein [Streptomyces sp. NPDC023838]|uniref:TetR-like C-terminal domain-containing protein n=1 Tax=Streptomyces sp. NPDC023838 TaxID=3154325 RepID=UPI0033F025B8